MGSRKRAKRLTSLEVISKRYSPARSQLGVDIQLSGFKFKQTCDFPSQALPVLKDLYHLKDDSIRVRALVVSSFISLYSLEGDCCLSARPCFSLGSL